MQLSTLFEDQSLLTNALTLAHNGKTADYERLEFLGDRVLGLIVADMLYLNYPTEKEGKLAPRFTELVREETLAQVARQLDIPAQLITREENLRANPSILADVCEAVLGALFLDKGFNAVQKFVTPIWTPIMHQYKTAPKDAKTRLQEWAQKKGYTLPVYRVIGKQGADHNPQFIIEAVVHGQAAQGIGHSKKEAEQIAAETLLHELKGHK